MTFKTAQEAFENALQIAERTEDSAAEYLAAGLLDLTKAIKSELAMIKRKADDIESKVRRLS